MLVHSLQKNDAPSGELQQETAAGRFIAVIEDRQFLRECFRRGIQPAFGLPIIGFSTIIELARRRSEALLELVILSPRDSSKEAITSALHSLRRLLPGVPIVFLFGHNDWELARTAISNGARGCIPITMRFDIAVEAVRFVMAGGTYVPMEYLLAPNWLGFPPLRSGSLTASFLDRELAVVRAIQKGKSNKAIAQELNIRESDVRFLLRNIVKKIKDRNRVV